MIDLTLNFLKQHLNKELNARLSIAAATESVKLSSIQKDGTPDDKIYITLINIEEEKILKNQEHFRRINSTDESYATINPEIKLNLYILISAHFTSSNYLEGLKRISQVILILQGKNVFNKSDLPAEFKILEKIVIEFSSQTIDQNNSLWQTIGGNLSPSVLYKVRVVIMQDNKIIGDTLEIKTRELNILHKEITEEEN